MTLSDLCTVCPGLSEMGWQIPAELDGRFELRTLQPHCLIHQKDTPLREVGILLKGSFRAVNEFENGNLFMIETNDPISFTGEVAHLSGYGITSVTLETVTECQIAFMPVKVFDEWLNRDVRLLRYISERIANKLYVTSYHRGERMFYSTKYVLLRYLLDEYDRARRQDCAVVIRKTRQQMCEEIGMSVNSINRLLTSFRQEKLIEMNHGKITMGEEQRRAAEEALKVYLMENRNGQR